MDTKNGVYTYTDRNGKKNQEPIELVNTLSQLQMGDHIAFPRRKKIYYHHAIVEDIDRQEGEIRVIENSPSAGENVQRKKYKFHVDTVYLIKHKKCLDAQQVVRNARRRLGERKYHIVINNCEHFANWCKTCSWSSEQVNMVERWVDDAITLGIIAIIVAFINI